jgi:hypothetical protein
MTQPPLIPAPSAEGPRPPGMSLLGRLLNVFATPGDVFDEVKPAPPCTANWLAPALLLIAVSWVAVWVIFSQDTIKHQLEEKVTQTLDAQVAKGKMSQADADRAREMGTRYGLVAAQVSAAAAPVFAAFISPFWTGLVFWLVGAKFFKGSFSYMKAVEAAGLTNIIYILDSVVKGLLIFGLGSLYVSPSLVLFARNLDPTTTLYALLTAANPLTFWLLAVRSIALSRLSGASFARCALWIFGIWAVFVCLGLGLGAIGRSLAPH